MNRKLCFIGICLLTASNGYCQTQVVSLKNATGIVEDNLGSVIRWDNQIAGYGHAIQTVSALGANQLQETYPGKVNVGFSKDGSFLALEGTSAYISDNTYSFFYVGKANPIGKPASLLGNYNIPGAFNNCAGIRFVMLEDGSINFDYAKPNYVRINLGTIPLGGYFFFGFTMNASGNYSYFDSNSSIVKTGTISTSMIANTEELKFNLFEEKDGSHTYNHTEVVEFSMFDGALSTADFQTQFERLTNQYPELVTAVAPYLKVDNVTPTQHLNISKTETIALTCNQNIDINSVLPKIYLNKGTTATAGTWSLTNPKTLSFTPSQNWPLGALVSLQIQEGLLSTDGGAVDISKRTKYDFIVETESTYGTAQNTELAAIATVDFPQVGHTLPLKITLPTTSDKKIPVHIWVHGGGWSGGSAASSNAAMSPHADYLAENLGVATLSISYRCSGSSGTFSLAMEDIDTAYQWALANADVYNFDMTKVFFSGGSAGTPLAALASQKYPAVIGFIGFNGIYDFVNDAGDFGNTNWYKQNIPSETINSAFFQLRTNPPATIMMHGDADTTISYKQSTLFADAINAKGATARAVIYPREVHAFFNPGQPAYEDVLYEMVTFMKDLLAENLSISDLLKENRFITYPNPVKKGETLKIAFNANNQKVAVQIINYLGQIVYDLTLFPESNIIAIDTNDLEKGNFILKINSNQNTQSLKIIIQ